MCIRDRWDIVKNQNCYLVKQNGKVFSKDPFNFTGKNTYASCGFINDNSAALSIVSLEKQKGKLTENYQLTFKKNLKFRQQTRLPTKNKNQKINSERQGFKLFCDKNVLQVRKSKINTVAKIISKKYQFARKGYGQNALRKLRLLSKINKKAPVEQKKQ
eukprot:TRINITY_DN176_c0_g1_i6.p3 TRINITY_DN176_c0_g1~~TRINITY_DN176_c0_g1_i6.p3  ORF type:complete len:180 (-),score=65.45 TRINITY_DN176_c0_g1_i6:111-587(-)